MAHFNLFSPFHFGRNKQETRHVDKLVSHPKYVSEFTHFIDEFLEEHPDVVDSQRTGWNIFWDKDLDPADLEKMRTNNIPVKPYQYD